MQPAGHKQQPAGVAGAGEDCHEDDVEVIDDGIRGDEPEEFDAHGVDEDFVGAELGLEEHAQKAVGEEQHGGGGADHPDLADDKAALGDFAGEVGPAGALGLAHEHGDGDRKADHGKKRHAVNAPGDVAGGEAMRVNTPDNEQKRRPRGDLNDEADAVGKAVQAHSPHELGVEAPIVPGVELLGKARLK